MADKKIDFCKQCPARNGRGASIDSSLQFFIESSEQGSGLQCWVIFTDTPGELSFVESDTLTLKEGDPMLAKFRRIADNAQLEKSFREYLTQQLARRCAQNKADSCLPLGQQVLREAINKACG